MEAATAWHGAEHSVGSALQLSKSFRFGGPLVLSPAKQAHKRARRIFSASNCGRIQIGQLTY